MKKIGVFVCHCGRNISSTVNIGEVVEEIRKYPGVVICTDYKYMCSDPGQNIIKEKIKEKNLNGVVVACCSPSLHEDTFRRITESTDLNRYLLEIANIREQCSWVHSNMDEATAKAINIIESIIEKTKLNESLSPVKVPVTPKALVIGAGIAGIQASLDIANSGYEVTLVEKNSSIGGHMAQLSETFPTLDCSQCILTPKMVEVSHHDNIKLFTYSELEEISGSIGNFKVKIRKKARYVDEEACTGCGDCWNLCPVQNSPQIIPFPKYSERIDEKDFKRINKIIQPYLNKKGSLIQALQDINVEYNYLPEFALEYVSERFNTPLSEIYHIATFYTSLSLQPRGEHMIKVCTGTACYARGAPRILEEIERRIGIKAGETTEDLKFTLQTVNCLGCCALGPVVMIDNNYHKMTINNVPDVLMKYSQTKGK